MKTPSKHPSRPLLRPACALLLTCLLSRANPEKFEVVPTRTHDPSGIVHDGDTAWIFSTGNGVRSHSSKDLETWTKGPPVFPRPLPWLKQVAPSQRGHLWAPDILKINDRFFLYYSVSAFGKQSSALALATSPSLDPKADDYHWSDQGIVLRSKAGDPYNAIDPSILLDGDQLWMSFGSFWDGIFLTELDPATGKLKDPDAKPIQLASAPEIEAPYLHKRGKFYYLFVNWGLCCRGVKSTYEIRVGRSEKVTGPYLDRDGIDLRNGGGSLVIGTAGDFVGPGHASIVRDAKGRERLACHYYDASRNGSSHLAFPLLRWTEGDWPEIPAFMKGDDKAAPGD